MTDGMTDPDAGFRAAGARVETFTPDRGTPFGRLRVLTLADARNAPPRAYLLPGLIAPGELSLWWGPPKCGKSFLLLRLVYGLAQGAGMWGREPAEPIRTLYVAAEGEGGFAGRLLALASEMGDAGDGFRYIAQRATVGPPADDLADVIAAAQHMRARLVVLDTLARTFGEGDENAARDMSGFVASIDRLREETGAHIAVVHHGTKEGGTARGSGALVGAADLIVKIARDAGEDAAGTATIEAAKDDADGAALGFRLRVVALPGGSDGATRRTCIAEEAESDGRAAKRLPPAARNALAYLADLIAAEGVALPAEWTMPADLQAVHEAAWRAACESRRLSLADKPEDRARTFRQAAGALRDAGWIALRDGWVWLPQTGDGGPDRGRIGG